MIRIGTDSVKIFRRNAVFGFLAPKCFAEKSLIEWEPRYGQFDTLRRGVCRGLLLYELIDLVSRAKSIAEVLWQARLYKPGTTLSRKPFWRRLMLCAS